MQTPIPYRETFVFDAKGLEGVHIRFGAVARGGLRWSNRLDDYRTEVLGLVKTQQTKNAVIIPVGSKGGFVIKTPQSPTFDDGIAQYDKRFISAMLQLADNIESGKKKLTKNLVTYDDFDPYFVVAADKGTATFSDFANKVSMNQIFGLVMALRLVANMVTIIKKLVLQPRGLGNAQNCTLKPWIRILKKILFQWWVLVICLVMFLEMACY